MKKFIKLIALLLIFTIFPVLLSAQNPPHPNGGNAPGGGNTPVGGGAPIDGGFLVMMALGSLYATRRVYQFKNKE
jgi:hypothetical protein